METMNKALFWLSEKIDSIGENRRDFAKNEKHENFVKLSSKFMNLERCIFALKEEDQRNEQLNLVSKFLNDDKKYVQDYCKLKIDDFAKKKVAENPAFLSFSLHKSSDAVTNFIVAMKYDMHLPKI